MRIKRHTEGTNNNRWHVLRTIISLFAASFALLLFLWVSSGMIHFLSSGSGGSKDDANIMIRRGSDTTTSVTEVSTDTSKRDDDASASSVALSKQTTVTIHNTTFYHLHYTTFLHQ